MKSTSFVPVVVILIIFFLLDLYTSRGLKWLTADLQSQFVKKAVLYVHWGLFIGFTIWILVATFNTQAMTNYKNYKFFYYLFGMLLLFYLPKLVYSLFILGNDILWLVKWAYAKLNASPNIHPEATKITRSRFLNQIGIVTATVPFIGAAYGMLKGRFDFRVIEKELAFENLPKAFDGFKIVQFSDAHLGSFFENFKPVEKAIELINQQNADVVLFTGDLVNNYSEEAEDWIQYFKQIKAKHGKYSILGNHDYGEYAKWPSAAAQRANLNRLKEIHGEMGFRLLLNENEVFAKNGEEIGLLGIENWGVPPFPQYGDLNKAKVGVENQPFKILLSHDPSHWDYQVLKEHKDIDLTLSGHTHGAQFGIELGNVKWSPVKYKYPRWAGLYKEGKQFLYVNRGFGYIGFPGRVGIPPELTVIKLKRT
tara:strand:+ start:6134 stop:7402 length:1269 start_codon:yes stop_codon:yes gene_type:complete